MATLIPKCVAWWSAMGIGALGVRESLGAGRDRRFATLSYFECTIPRAIDQSEYVFCDGKHVEARNLTSSPV